MIDAISTIIIDHDKNFVDLLINAIERTDNLKFVGSAKCTEEVNNISREFIPSLVLLNIDLENSNSLNISRELKNKFPEAYLVIMNMDDKKFASNNSEEMVADNYLDKHSLFEEINKISSYFKEKPKLDKVVTI